MSISWVIAGTFFQAFLALFLFMLVVFSGAGVMNTISLSKFEINVVDFAMFFLPTLCIFCAGVVIYQYNTGGGVNSYWWYASPLVLTVCYFIYLKFN